MLDLLVADVFAVLTPMLGRLQTLNLSFVCRRLTKIVGFTTREDMLAYSIQESNLLFYLEYLRRLPSFPLGLTPFLGKANNSAMIKAAFEKVPKANIYDFKFNIARGLLLANHHQEFAMVSLGLDPGHRRHVILEYFNDSKNINCSVQILTGYLRQLTRKELFPDRMANVFRAVPEFAHEILTYNYGSNWEVMDAAFKSNSSQVVLTLHNAGYRIDRYPIINFAYSNKVSTCLAKQLAESNAYFTEIYICVLTRNNETDLLLENARVLFDQFPKYIEDIRDKVLEKVLAGEQRFHGNIFPYLRSIMSSFAIAFRNGYQLAEAGCGLWLLKGIAFHPSIVTTDDPRLALLFMKKESLAFVEMAMKYEDSVTVDYELVACKENAELLIKKKKLSADYCCGSCHSDLAGIWVRTWGVEDLNEKQCMYVYYYYSKLAASASKKRSTSVFSELMQLIERNKQNFLNGIFAARKGGFLYETLCAIADHVSGLTDEQRQKIKELTGRVPRGGKKPRLQ